MNNTDLMLHDVLVTTILVVGLIKLITKLIMPASATTCLLCECDGSFFVRVILYAGTTLLQYKAGLLEAAFGRESFI